MDISFIILNYQSEQYLKKCLLSVKKNFSSIRHEIIVVNNDASDLKIDFCEPDSQVLNNHDNLGFSRACNLGAKKARGRILFFLNPDTELLDDKLIDFLPFLERESIGIIAPLLMTADGKPQAWSGGKMITPLGTLLRNVFKKKNFFSLTNPPIRKLEWVSGAAFLIKKTLFERLGGFDEKFFMYFEDVDFCKRVTELGKEILLFSQSIVLHHGGGSVENAQTQKKLYYESQDYYFKKHFGPIEASLIKFIRNIFLTKKNEFFGSENILFHAFVLLCALLPLQFALNPTTAVDLAIIRVIIPLLFLVRLFYAIKNKKLFERKIFLNYCILGFLFLAVISMLFSPNIQWSLRKLAFLFSFFPLYFIASFLLNDKRRERLTVSALVFGASIASVFALTQFCLQFLLGIDRVCSFLAKFIIPFFLGNNFSKEVLAYPSWLVNSGGTTYMRAFAPFPDPHMLSYYVGMLFPWSIALWATAQTKLHKIFFLLAAVLLGLCDIATFTRGGYLALTVAALVVMPLVSKQTVKKIIFGVCFFVLLFFIVPKNPATNPVAGRVVSTFNINEGSNQGRIAMWKLALSTISKHPQGVGIGAYPLSIDPDATYRTPIYAHNAYLDIAVELGFIAMIVFIIILAASIRSFWLASRKSHFYVAGVASLIIFAIHSLVENPFYSVHVLPLLLILFAISSNHTFSTTEK